MARTAPLVEAYRRRGAVFRKTRGTGEVNDGQALMVEMLVEGLWVNLSLAGLIHYRSKVTLTRGASSEGQQSDAGSCQFAIKNLDGAFSANNPLAQYWGKFGLGTRIRVSVPDGFGKSYRFQGEVQTVEEQADQSGQDLWVDVTAAGILDRLGRGDKPTRSTLYREIMSPDPAGRRTIPVAYWPMEDESGSETLANAVAGGRAMTFIGDPELQAFDQFDCSDNIVNIASTKFTGVVNGYANNTTKPRAASVWFLLGGGGAPATNTILLSVSTTTQRFEISYVATDNIRVQIFDHGNNTSVYDSGSVSVPVVGLENWFMLFLTNDGTGMVGALSYQLVTSTTINTPLSFSGLGTSGDNEVVTRVQVNPKANTADVYMGHVAVFQHRQTDENTADGYFPTDGALTGYNGERADVRFARLCREEQITFETVPAVTTTFIEGVYQGVGQKMGPQKVGTLPDLLRQCEETDGGMIYEMLSDFGLGYRTLYTITSQSAAVTLSAALNQPSSQPTPKRDTQKVTNDVTIRRIGGSSANVTDITSKYNSLPPPTGIGRFDSSDDLNLYTDVQALDEASWRVHLGTVAEPRYDSVSVLLQSNEIQADLTLRSQLLGVDTGDRIDLGDLPVRLGYEDIRQVVFGNSETIDQFVHAIEWNTAPEEPYRTAVFDDDTYDRLDSGTATVASAVSAAETSLSVATTDGTEWVTTASNAAEFPFDIMVEGERMTVTAITSASSPQTFTVTRAVNGVSKPITAGAQVHVYYAFYWAL